MITGIAALLELSPPVDDEIAEKIVDAAIDEFTEYGMRRVSVDNIARRAGVHRVTVYKRFKNKDEVMIAASVTWLARYFTVIGAAVLDQPTPQDRLVEAFALALHNLRSDPLANRLLYNDADAILPYLTTKGGPAIAAVRTVFAEYMRAEATLDSDRDIDEAAELIVRTGLSFMLTPQSIIANDSLDDIRALARRYLAPLFEPR